MRRALMIGLDGFEISLAESMMSEGLLPHLSRLRREAARFRLEHGEAKYSGLTWEHFSAGISAESGGRQSAVAFDPRNYQVNQPVTKERPFLTDLPIRSVVFDLPYCDIELAPTVRGVANWGAHDPGIASFSRPAELLPELHDHFGVYPAKEWIYGFTWPSPTRTQIAAEKLEEAVRVRTRVAKWLFGERLLDWDLGIIVVSEPHSAIEPFWHGVDPAHPLHNIESGPIASNGLRGVYCAVDELVGTFRTAFPDTVLFVFAMHGMGPNAADLPAMVLLPELLYRHAFGKPYMRPLKWPAYLPNGIPLLDSNDDWGRVMRRAVPWPTKAAARPPLDAQQEKPVTMLDEHEWNSIAWMPATRYQNFWPKMPAFALPAYYDARIRINLAGRESAGFVGPESYNAVREQLVRILTECRDPLTGQSVVERIHGPEKRAMDLDEYDADIYVKFRGTPVGLEHPTLGTVGPLPYRRTGGHTGRWGFLYIAGDGIRPYGEKTARSFDVVTTAVSLVGISPPPQLGGTPMVSPFLS